MVSIMEFCCVHTNMDGHVDCLFIQFGIVRWSGVNLCVQLQLIMSLYYIGVIMATNDVTLWNVT